MVGHPSIELFKKCNEIMKGSYPGVVKAIPEQLGCTAFFPGGYGLWLNEENNDLTRLPQFPVGGIMAVSRCFDTVENYSKYLSEWKNEKCIHCSNMQGNFWQGLIDIYKGARLDMKSTFFTNVYMGMYKIDKIKKNSMFHKKSIQCLKKQIEIQKPKAIIAIGVGVANLFPLVFNELHKWKKAKVDDFYNGSTEKLINIKINNHSCIAAFMYSPCMRKYNDVKITLASEILKKINGYVNL